MSRDRRTATAALRFLSRPFLVLLAGAVATTSHATPSAGELNARRQPLWAFFDELGSDRMLRARFAQSPRDVLGERGLDLPGVALPDRLTEREIDSLLKQWPIVHSTSPSVADVVAVQPTPGPQVPVYGPPPGPKRREGGDRAPPRIPDPAPDQPDDSVPPSSGVPPADRD